MRKFLTYICMFLIGAAAASGLQYSSPERIYYTEKKNDALEYWQNNKA